MRIDLTRGGITRPMLLFAGPMIAGDLLQQCYNIADTLIVGRALGPTALAAVGFSFTLMTFLTSVLLGLCMGSGALWSMLHGAGETDGLKRCLFASFLLIGGAAVALNVGVLVFLEPIMTLLRIPPEAWADTWAYLRVVLFGVCFTFLYNYFACLLRSVGNSTAPLVFLAASTVLNIGLDLWFVLGLHWGVAGAAGATVLAQGVSAAGIAFYCWRTVDLLRLERRHLTASRGELKRIVSYSALACVQQSVMNFGILMVQGLVNSFGVHVMAAFAAGLPAGAGLRQRLLHLCGPEHRRAEGGAHPPRVPLRPVGVGMLLYGQLPAGLPLRRPADGVVRGPGGDRNRSCGGGVPAH